MTAPPHAASFGTYLSLMGTRAAPEVPLAEDPTLAFLALSRERGMFRAESNLRFAVPDAIAGRRLVVLREPEATMIAEAVGACRDFLSLHAIECAECVATRVSDDRMLEDLLELFPAVGLPPCRVERAPVAAVSDGEARLLVEFELRAKDGTPHAWVRRLQMREGAAMDARVSVAGAAEVPGPAPPVSVAYFDEGVIHDALRIALEVRRAGMGCWVFHGAKNLAKHLRLADRFGVKWIVIVGGREWERGEVALRESASKAEISVPPARVVEELRARIQKSE